MNRNPLRPPINNAVKRFRRNPSVIMQSKSPSTNYNSTRIITLPPISHDSKLEDGIQMKAIAEEPKSDESIPVSSSNLSTIFYTNQNNFFEKLPPIPPARSSKFNTIFYAKCSQCKQICDFYNPNSEIEGKAIKQSHLEDIISLFHNAENLTYLTENHIQVLFDVVSTNLKRPLPVQSAMLFEDDIPPIVDPSWPHLTLIYQLLQRLLLHYNLPEFFNDSFIFTLISVMNTPDSNEQTVLIKCLKIILQEFPHKMEPILQNLSSSIERTQYNDRSPFFMQANLTIIFYIITHSPKITTQIYKVFIFSIIPLIHDPHLSMFYPQLRPILEFFIDEKPVLAFNIFQDLIKHWPFQILSKQVIYLELLTYLLDKLPKREIEANLSKIFGFYAEGSRSPSVKVAENAYSFWTSMRCDPLMRAYSKTIIPIMYQPIVDSRNFHWNSTIRENATLALRVMMRFDSKTVQFCSEKKPYGGNQNQDDLRNWATIARQAARADRTVNLGGKLSEISQLCKKNVSGPMQAQSTSNSYRASNPVFSL